MAPMASQEAPSRESVSKKLLEMADLLKDQAGVLCSSLDMVQIKLFGPEPKDQAGESKTSPTEKCGYFVEMESIFREIRHRLDYCHSRVSRINQEF